MSEENILITREVPVKLMCRRLATWFALELQPKEFDKTLLEDILCKYGKLVKCRGRDTESILSDKQYKILYNVYANFNVANIFAWNKLKFNCFGIKEFGYEVKSSQDELCEDYIFEIFSEEGKNVIWRVKDFKQEFNNYILKPVMYSSSESDFD